MSLPKFAAVLLAALFAAYLGAAADRQWQNGTWRESGDAKTYVIVTDTVRLHLEDVPPGDKRALDVVAGQPVKFAIEGSRVFVVDASAAEHELRLLRSVDLKYAATGAGHFIKTMSTDGATVTLEDDSVWELDPRAHFFTINWQPFEGIAVRTTDPENGFNYEIDNTDRDDGALARYTPR